MTNQESHVIFGTGPVGQAVCARISATRQDGEMVNAVAATRRRPSSVPVIAGDVFDTVLAKNLAQGATHVYQCTNPAYHEWVEKFPTLQANTLEAAADAGAKYIVMDNVYMYGDTNGQPICEDLPTTRTTKKAACARAWPRSIGCAPGGQGARRDRAASDFYGPAVLLRRRASGCLVLRSKAKRPAWWAASDARHSSQYIDDIAKCW